MSVGSGPHAFVMLALSAETTCESGFRASGIRHACSVSRDNMWVCKVRIERVHIMVAICGYHYHVSQLAGRHNYPQIEAFPCSASSTETSLAGLKVAACLGPSTDGFTSLTSSLTQN